MPGTLLLYDMDCGFCTRAAGWVRRSGLRTAVAGIQESDLAAYGIDPERAVREMPVVLPDGNLAWGHHGWAAALRTGPLPCRLVAAILEAGPLDALSGRGYRWVSEHRHRMPGGTAGCAPGGAPQPRSRRSRLERVADDGTAHATPAATSPAEFGGHDRDDLDPRLA